MSDEVTGGENCEEMKRFAEDTLRCREAIKPAEQQKTLNETVSEEVSQCVAGAKRSRTSILVPLSRLSWPTAVTHALADARTQRRSTLNYVRPSDNTALSMTSVPQSTSCSDSLARRRGSPSTWRTLSSSADILSLPPCHIWHVHYQAFKNCIYILQKRTISRRKLSINPRLSVQYSQKRVFHINWG